MPDSTREKDCIANKKLGELCFLMCGWILVSSLWSVTDLLRVRHCQFHPAYYEIFGASSKVSCVCLTYSDIIKGHRMKSRQTVNEILSLTPEADSAILSVSYGMKDTFIHS